MRYSYSLQFLFLFLISPLIGGTQTVSFEASSDARQVVLGGVFSVDFTLSNADGSNFTPPDFKDFEVLGGPNESRRVSIVNGKRSQSFGIGYSLQPKKTGTFMIPSARIQVDGKTLQTRPLRIQVVKGKTSNATTKEELDQELSDGIFVQAIIDKEASKIGEQIILDYKLYVSRNVESYNIVNESEYAGFFVHEMRRYNSQQMQEVVDGVQYTTKLIKKIALFPQQAGTFNIDPMAMNISIAIGDNRRRNIFSRPKVNTFTINTEPIEITVESLPAAPPSFSGAVGSFQMNATINREKLTTDDAISMKMTIRGNGDIKQVQAPKLALSDKFEIYDPKVLEESNYEENGELTGKKVFEYLILPKEAGAYKIAGEFSYYDSDSLDFVTLRSKEFPLAISKGNLDQKQVIADIKKEEKKEDIRFIKTNVDLGQEGCSFIGSGFFWTLFTLPFLLLGGVLVLRQIEAGKANIDPLILKRKRAVKIAQKRLAQAEQFKSSGNSKAFYDEVSRASFGYVCDKLNIPFSELTKQNVSSKLQSLQVTDQSIDKFLQIVKTCEMALFAGKDNAAAMNETYQYAIEVIAEIEEQTAVLN